MDADDIFWATNGNAPSGKPIENGDLPIENGDFP